MSTHHLQFQQLRRAKGLTLQAIADAAGISLTDVYLFEIHCLTDAALRCIKRIFVASDHFSHFQHRGQQEKQKNEEWAR